MPFVGTRKQQYNQRYYRQRKHAQQRTNGHRQTHVKPRSQGDAYVLQPIKKMLVTFRLDEPLVARCHELKERAIATGEGRWKTIAQVYRGLILKGFESLKDDPIVDSALPYLQLVKQVEGMKQPRLEAEGVAHSAKQEITRLLDIQAFDQAAQFYATVMQQADALDPTIWRDWLIEELQLAYPDLEAARVGGVKLRKQKARPDRAHPKAKGKRQPTRRKG